MKTSWDYSKLAKAYLKRPGYAEEAIEKVFNVIGKPRVKRICDIGAGVGHLTLHISNRAELVAAIEPNDNMRGLGVERTRDFGSIVWFEGCAEETKAAEAQFDIVTFGSSFNVTDRVNALQETKRIAVPGGYFVAMWNHRDLSDAIQANIESIIKNYLPEYDYGTRREDQTEFLEESGFFEWVQKVDGKVVHLQSKEDIIEAWRSHATLERQAASKFGVIVDEISKYLNSVDQNEIEIPYTTNVWIGKLAI